jgi:hypothetical protein
VLTEIDLSWSAKPKAMGLHCEIDPSATIVRLAEKEKARAGLLGSAAAAGPLGRGYLPPRERQWSF